MSASVGEDANVMGLAEDGDKISWNCWLRTVFAASGAFGVYFLSGMHDSMSASMIPQLEKENSSIQVTQDEKAWIASLGILMAPVSAMLTGPFIDAYGRKKGLLGFYLLVALGFAITAIAQDVYQIYIGQIMCAFGTGLDMTAVIYMAEICTEKQRSILFSQLSVVFSAGGMLPFLISKYLSWNIMAAIFCLISILFFFAQCFGPESPAWLFKSGQWDASVKSFRRLGRTKPQIERELDLLKQSRETSKEKIELQTFLEPTVWKPFLIMCLFNLLAAAVGEYQVSHYTVDFVKRLQTTYDPLNASVVLSTSIFISNITIAIYVKSNFGRKLATALSSSFMALALITAGTYEYAYREVTATERTLQWLPLGCMVVYTVAETLGMASFPWNMSGELFPLKVRGTMSGVVYVVGAGLAFISVKMYYVCIDALEIHGLLFAFAGAAVAAVFFAVFVLPETHNRHLHEIEESFRPKHLKVDTFDAES